MIVSTIDSEHSETFLNVYYLNLTISIVIIQMIFISLILKSNNIVAS